MLVVILRHMVKFGAEFLIFIIIIDIYQKQSYSKFTKQQNQDSDYNYKGIKCYNILQKS